MSTLADAMFAKVLFLQYEGKADRNAHRFADRDDLRAARARTKKRA